MAEGNSDPQPSDSQEISKVEQASQAPPIVQYCHQAEGETTEEPTPISEQTSESSSPLHHASPYPLRT